MIPFGVISSAKQPPAPSCSVSLNADVADLFGAPPFDVINAEDATSAGDEAQGAGLPTFDVTWSGERSIEFVVDKQDASGTFLVSVVSTTTLATAENDRITLIINGDDLGLEILINNVSQNIGSMERSTDITVGHTNATPSATDFGVKSFTAYPAAKDIQNGRGSDWCGESL